MYVKIDPLLFIFQLKSRLIFGLANTFYDHQMKLIIYNLQQSYVVSRSCELLIKSSSLYLHTHVQMHTHMQVYIHALCTRIHVYLLMFPLELSRILLPRATWCMIKWEIHTVEALENKLVSLRVCFDHSAFLIFNVGTASNQMFPI